MACVPPWWADVHPRLVLRARVVDYWAAGNGTSRQLVGYLRWLGFEVDFDGSQNQKGSACAFVAARAVVDLHTAGEDWWGCIVHRAADAEWVRSGNVLLERTLPHEIEEGFMASSDDVEKLILGFWQNDAPHEPRTDLNGWLATPCATPIDRWMASFAHDLKSAASVPSVTRASDAANEWSSSPRLCVVNTCASTGSGLHWFVVAYSILPRADLDVDSATPCDTQSTLRLTCSVHDGAEPEQLPPFDSLDSDSEDEAGGSTVHRSRVMCIVPPPPRDKIVPEGVPINPRQSTLLSR